MLISVNLLYLFLVAAVICWLVTFFVRQLAFKWQVVDQPDPNNPRKIHKQATPLIGGWSIFISLAVIAAYLYWQDIIPDEKVTPLLLVGFFTAGLILMIGGFLDDKFKLRWWQALFFPVLASLTILWAGLAVDYLTNPFGGLLYLDSWQYGLPSIFVFLWLLGMTYTTKLLDGLDGLATSISLIASIVIFIVSLFWDDRGSTTTYLSIVLAGSLLGFLIWNWHPAKIFLGESGSTFIGFSLGVLAILTGGKIATALLVMGLPILDVVWVIARRLMSTRKISLADTGHMHFRLLRLGLSQRQVVVFMSVISLLFGSVSFFTTTQGKIIALIVLFLLMLLLGSFVVYKQKKNET